ncbi:MAG: carbon-nitrogen hydrolase family protein [Magnetococcus sp. MYC-9]
MRAAVIQLCTTADREENLRLADHWMVLAVQQGAGLLVLPENFSFMGRSDEERRRHWESRDDTPSLSFLQAFSRRHRVWIVGGSIPMRLADSNKVHNSCFVVDAEGEIRGRYDKIHLFDAELGGETPYRESDTVLAGQQAVVVESPFGRLGLTICYDLRFPELFRALVQQGATLFTVPAAFTRTTGQAHWEVLLRARAIENFSYVLAAGQGGTHVNGRHTFGHSLIVEPWGEVVARCADGPGFALAELHPERVAQSRRRVPCLHHRTLFMPTPGDETIRPVS